MSERSFARFKVASVLVFGLGLASVAVAYALQAGNSKLRHRTGFTLVMKETAAASTNNSADAKQIAYTITTRYQRSDGSWRQIRRYYNGLGKIIKKDLAFAVPGRGVFRIDSARGVLDFLSSMPPKEKSSYVAITDGHDDPHFLKDDNVSGYATYVLRFSDEDGYTDLYYAPQLDGQIIREVHVSKNAVAVNEPIQITLGDPDERVFASQPRLVVSYDHFKEKIAAMEQGGKHEAAEAMRRELEAELAKDQPNK
jgi:hypothetical protein